MEIQYAEFRLITPSVAGVAMHRLAQRLATQPGFYNLVNYGTFNTVMLPVSGLYIVTYRLRFADVAGTPERFLVQEMRNGQVTGRASSMDQFYVSTGGSQDVVTTVSQAFVAGIELRFMSVFGGAATPSGVEDPRNYVAITFLKHFATNSIWEA